MNKKNGYTIIEFLLVVTLVATVFVLAIARLKANFTERRNETYVRYYCEILDNALYKAKVENRLEDIRSTTPELLIPYLRGTYDADSSTITMNDGSVISRAEDDYVVVFPTGVTHNYHMADTKDISCTTTAEPESED